MHVREGTQQPERLIRRKERQRGVPQADTLRSQREPLDSASSVRSEDAARGNAMRHNSSCTAAASAALFGVALLSACSTSTPPARHRGRTAQPEPHAAHQLTGLACHSTRTP